jgi:hypothetical protein
MPWPGSAGSLPAGGAPGGSVGKAARGEAGVKHHERADTNSGTRKFDRDGLLSDPQLALADAELLAQHLR